jgi:hypothetical protein
MTPPPLMTDIVALRHACMAVIELCDAAVYGREFGARQALSLLTPELPVLIRRARRVLARLRTEHRS